MDEAALCKALGLNPDNVIRGSISVSFGPQGGVLQATIAMPIPTRALGMALLAADPPQTEEERVVEDESGAEAAPDEGSGDG